ncbi:hypothetical protein P5673_012551 [Acropora cervicornis]|uniref:Uncharacterized protein n=1 Tax=Acropora cervicornis TaxID=6130 RepID=A0AAD9QN38_ACRCE|nr:hypothetical protein P5673_012551 [Acropora cervicornis]
MEAIIGEEKEFGMRYNFDKEILTIDHYYGYWNDHGWPQHIWDLGTGIVLLLAAQTAEKG